MSRHAVDIATAEPLLGPGEPPPFEVLNADSSAPFLLVCDHASDRIPQSLGNLGLDAADLGRHIAVDIGAGPVTRLLAERLEAPAILAGYSRLVVDNNRFPEDPTSIPEISDGTIVPGNRRLGEADIARRRAALFDPYQAAIAARLDAMTGGGRVPALVSIHSFTPVFKGTERPWHVGLLWDKDPRLPLPLLDALRENPGIVADENVPYSARDPYGYTVTHHADAHGLPNVLVEIRQDLIDTRQGAEDWAQILGDAFARVLADTTLYREAHY